jgi:hypothetical protein
MSPGVEVVVPAESSQTSYIDWPAIIGGIVLASAISLLLLTFGSAIGLGFINFHAREGADPTWIAIAAGTWLLWVEVSSFMAGAYLTGRLRRRHGDGTEQESDVRDGAHGLLVWAGALVVGAALAAMGLGAVASAAGGAAATATQAAATALDDGSAGPDAYFTDMLFRPAPAAAPATTPGAAPVTAPENTDALRGEAGRILARTADGTELTADDRSYLQQVVAANTGLGPEDADARITQVTTALDAARQQAADVAEAARKSGIVAAFLTAAALLVGAIGAFWAAQKGGDHRDKGTVFHDVFRRF